MICIRRQAPFSNSFCRGCKKICNFFLDRKSSLLESALRRRFRDDGAVDALSFFVSPEENQTLSQRLLHRFQNSCAGDQKRENRILNLVLQAFSEQEKTHAAKTVRFEQNRK